MPWQTATVVAIRDETPRAKTFRLALDEPSRASRRPALRRAPDRARRLHRVALVLGRVGRRTTRRTRSSSRSSGSSDGEVSTFLHDVVERRRRARGARADRRMVRVGGRHAGAARRRRLGGRAAHGDAAARPPDRPIRPRAAGRVGAHARRPLLRRRAARGPRRRSSTRARCRRPRAVRRAGSARRHRAGRCCPTPPRTCAARPGSRTRRATSSSTSVCRSTGSASSASARPADRPAAERYCSAMISSNAPRVAVAESLTSTTTRCNAPPREPERGLVAVADRGAQLVAAASSPPPVPFSSPGVKSGDLAFADDRAVARQAAGAGDARRSW